MTQRGEGSLRTSAHSTGGPPAVPEHDCSAPDGGSSSAKRTAVSAEARESPDRTTAGLERPAVHESSEALRDHSLQGEPGGDPVRSRGARRLVRAVPDEIAGILAAFGFLTRLPLPRRLPPAGALERSVAWFPLVGALVGLLAALGLLGAAWLWPWPLPALVAVAVAVAVTGGFHEDGLADTADALAAGGDRERRLRVLDDPRIGAVGAVVLVLVLLGRVAALALLPLAAAAAALVAAHALARWTVPALLWRLPYVRGESGVAAGLKRGATGGRLAVATLLVGVLLGALAFADLKLPGGGAAPALAVGATLLLTLAAAAFFRRRFGGVTGDLLGATCQVVELGVYLAVLAMVHRGGFAP